MDEGEGDVEREAFLAVLAEEIPEQTTEKVEIMEASKAGIVIPIASMLTIPHALCYSDSYQRRSE